VPLSFPLSPHSDLRPEASIQSTQASPHKTKIPRSLNYSLCRSTASYFARANHRERLRYAHPAFCAAYHAIPLASSAIPIRHTQSFIGLHSKPRKVLYSTRTILRETTTIKSRFMERSYNGTHLADQGDGPTCCGFAISSAGCGPHAEYCWLDPARSQDGDETPCS